MENELEQKQNYLREEILEKGYDPNNFTSFLEEIKGDCAFDLHNWTMEELKEQVSQFKLATANGNYNGHGNSNSNNNQSNNIITLQMDNLDINKSIKGQNPNLNSSSLSALLNEGNSKTLQCKMQVKSMLTNMNDLTITISNPELIKGGLFSFSYYQFSITSNELQSKCTRKLSDFEWLRGKLVELYPGIFIPPFPSSSYFETSSSDKISKKQRTMSKFIDCLIKNELIRSSKLFMDFITLTQDKFEETKRQFNKTGTPKSIQDIVSLDGYLDISISDEKDTKANKIANDFPAKCKLYSDLSTSIKNLFNEFTVLSVKFNEVSKAFNFLTKAYLDTPHCESIQHFLLSLTNLTDQWSQSYMHQKQFFKVEVKEFFKYIAKELNEFDSLFTEFNTSRSYYNEYVMKVRDHQERDSKSKDKAISLKLEKEAISSKLYYGFLLNRIINEYDRLNSIHSERINKQFLQFNDKKNILLGDYINLLNFLSGSNE